MTTSTSGPYLISAIAALAILGACRTAAPPIRFAPVGTDLTTLRSKYALTDFERRMLNQEAFRKFSQEQVDQIYMRLRVRADPRWPVSRRSVLSPRSRRARAHPRPRRSALPADWRQVAALRAERLGRRVLEREGVLPLAGDPAQSHRGPADSEADHQGLRHDSEADVRRPDDMAAVSRAAVVRREPARPDAALDRDRLCERPEDRGLPAMPDRLAGPEGLNISRRGQDRPARASISAARISDSGSR